jgi:hypothetical protein
MAADQRGITDVLSDLMRESAHLVRSEIRLARTELSEKIGTIGAAIGMVAGGAVLLMAALVLLLQAAVDALVESGWSRPVATLTVGFIVLAVGALIAWIGLNRMKAKNLAPARTIEHVKRDAAVAKQVAS